MNMAYVESAAQLAIAVLAFISILAAGLILLTIAIGALFGALGIGRQ